MLTFIINAYDIQVSVTPLFNTEASSVRENSFIWDYRVFIENKSNKFVQIINRYWKIIDKNGFVKEFQGEGVVGMQPIIQPGQTFQYTSSVELNVDSGVMCGKYKILLDQEYIEYILPTFSLDRPGKQVNLN